MEVNFPSISPDGTKIVFDNHNGDIYVISMEGGQPRKIVEGYCAFWSPDGNYLTYRGFSENDEMGVADVRTGKNFGLPDPQEMGGFWITQDTLVAANKNQTKFLTFSLRPENGPTWVQVT
jgi:WD40 repeat protein